MCFLCFFPLVVISVNFILCCVYRGLFKNDKVLGTAQLKLEGLENHCEIREILEVSVDYACKHPHMFRGGLTARVYVFVGDGWT